MGCGALLAAEVGVLVLEARFHPEPDDPSLMVVVGHVVWFDASDEHPVVQPSWSLMEQPAPATMLSKLQYLVATASPDSFGRLQGLRSRFWSFVNVSSA